jgi:hypothetical protein
MSDTYQQQTNQDNHGLAVLRQRDVDESGNGTGIKHRHVRESAIVRSMHSISSLGRAALGCCPLSADRVFLVAKTPLIIALGAYLAGPRSQDSHLGLAMELASLLWLGLYALNESSDAAWERGTRARFYSGQVAIIALLALVIVTAALFIDAKLSGLFLSMVATQIAYSLPPLRLKCHWEFVILISGVVNPLLRMSCGSMFGDHPVPVLAYVTVVLLHLGGALRTRLLRRERDHLLGYRVAPNVVHFPGIVFTMLGLLGTCFMCWRGILPSLLTPCAIAGLAFAAYAWSRQARDVAILRKAWVLIAAFLPLGLLVLLRQ